MSLPPDLRLPSLDGLRAFEAAARLGSFERAAEVLSITASAVSKRVAAVEELLGAPLLNRGAKTLSLTATGKEYLEHVRAALGLLAAVPLHQRRAQRVQRLRVCAPPTFARQILVPRLQDFTEAHPDIDLEVVLSIPYLGGDTQDADIEVRNTDAIEAPALMVERVLPVAAPALIERLGGLRAPEDLARAPLLRTPLEPWAPWLRAAGLTWPEPSAGPKLVDLGLTLEAAVAGQGIALARPSLARHWIAAGALKPLFDLSVEPAGQYRLLPHATTGAAPEFARWLARICERAAAEAWALVVHALETHSGQP